jgi:hypothetical protein
LDTLIAIFVLGVVFVAGGVIALLECKKEAAYIFQLHKRLGYIPASVIAATIWGVLGGALILCGIYILANVSAGLITHLG